MLIKKDYSYYGRSRYQCDRCNTELTTETKRGIYIQYDKGSPKKQWDLCTKCFAALKKGIEKGSK